MDRRTIKLLFSGIMTLISLAWYALGNDSGSVEEHKFEQKMLAKAKEMGADQQALTRDVDDTASQLN